MDPVAWCGREGVEGGLQLRMVVLGFTKHLKVLAAVVVGDEEAGLLGHLLEEFGSSR